MDGGPAWGGWQRGASPPQWDLIGGLQAWARGELACPCLPAPGTGHYTQCRAVGGAQAVDGVKMLGW